MSSTIDSSTGIESSASLSRANRSDGTTALRELSVLKQAITVGDDTAQSSIVSTATVVNIEVQDLKGNIAAIEKALSQPGGDKAGLRKALADGKKALASIQAEVGRINNALNSAGVPGRLVWSDRGVSTSNVDTGDHSTSSTPTDPVSQGLTADSSGDGFDLDTVVPESVRSDPFFQDIQSDVNDFTSGNDQNGDLEADDTSSSRRREVTGEGEGAQLGNGTVAMATFLTAVTKKIKEKAEEEANGGAPANGAPNAKTGKRTAGNGSGSVSSFATPIRGGASTAAGNGTTPGEVTASGNNNLPISSFSGDHIASAGVAGDPLLGKANINGFLMMVLLQCYQEGQKNLLNMAQRLQDINKLKKSKRLELEGLRKSDPSGKNNAVQDEISTKEDELNSLGDDAQLQQLDLQNLAQQQQELLQLVSNFSKNTHDDSMAIIRHIGGG